MFALTAGIADRYPIEGFTDLTDSQEANMHEPRIAGSFICVRDIQGIRHAVRLASVTTIQDADEDQTETLIVINNGRARILVPYPMDSILDEVIEADPSFGPRARVGRP